MNIFILANEEQKKEILTRLFSEEAFVNIASSFTDFDPSKDYDAFFILNNVKDIDPKIFNGKPVFINQVIETLSERGYNENDLNKYLNLS